jgi:hypothetical protein
LSDKKSSTNRLLVKARQLVLILERDIDDEELPNYSKDEGMLSIAIDEFIELTRCRCENCGKKMPQDQIDIGYRFCCKQCNKDYFTL